MSDRLQHINNLVCLVVDLRLIVGVNSAHDVLPLLDELNEGVVELTAEKPSPGRSSEKEEGGDNGDEQSFGEAFNRGFHPY